MSGTTTPMMAQYLAMRKSLPADIILFYRLGDFYEMFFEDAKTAAPILNVALTKRGGTPMCGVPYHAAQNYIARLLKAGKRVAIAEQTSEAIPGKLVDREIARILTAGSIDDLTLLDDQRPNYLAALSKTKSNFGLAAIDHTTGEFIIAEFIDPAQLHRHTRPTLTQGTELIISNGRHPVLEQTLTETKFVPNDTELLPESSRLQILTGPNMAGKSTYNRQLA